MRGSLFRNEVLTTRERLVRTSIAAWLAERGHPTGVRADKPALSLESWLTERVAQLGIQSNDDLPLLSGSEVTLRPPKGSRAEPPGQGYLPKFPGLKVLVDGPRGPIVVRARG
jgi:hypothetical protein